MRKTVQVYVLALSVLASVSTPALAASRNAGSDDSFFTRVKNAIVRLFDEAKISVPVT
jgi:hypothetical protein